MLELVASGDNPPSYYVQPTIWTKIHVSISSSRYSDKGLLLSRFMALITYSDTP